MIVLVDVSAAQGDIPDAVWHQLRAAGCVGAIIKVTEGPYIDGRARANIERARAAGLVVGVYAFARMSLGEARVQVDALWSAMGDTMPGLPPVLDLESAPDGWGAERIVAWAEEWAIAAFDKFGRWPTLYSYPYFLQHLGDALRSSRILAQCALWIAGGKQYINGDGHIPDLTREQAPLIQPWGAAWTFWQFDGNGGKKLPNGVDCDWNIFNGDEAAFHDFRGIPDAPPTEPEIVVIHPPIEFQPPEPSDE